jgi:hypothetical protein
MQPAPTPTAPPAGKSQPAHAAQPRGVWRARLTLVATAVLFFGWLGWLAYLVATRPVILLRTQVLVADAVVIAQVDDLDRPVTVREITRARSPQESEALLAQPIHITNLSKCQADWQGPGEYILPLLFNPEAVAFEVAGPSGYNESEQKEWRQKTVVVHSRTPGFQPFTDDKRWTTRPPRIYPVNSQTRAQLRSILEQPD